MADRKGEQNGYNIPEVCEADEVSKWFATGSACYDQEPNNTNLTDP